VLVAGLTGLATGGAAFAAIRTLCHSNSPDTQWTRTLATSGLAFVGAVLTAAHTIDFPLFAGMFWQDRVLAWEGKRNGVLDEDVVEYLCLPTDIDRNGHMNNAKFMRVLNFARRSFWTRNGGWGFVLARAPPTNMIVTASTIRHRREIKCWASYQVVTRLLHWEGTNFYLEHRFVQPSDGFVLAICFVKYRLVSDDKASAADILGCLDTAVREWAPSPSPELAAWISYDELSSKALRPTEPSPSSR